MSHRSKSQFFYIAGGVVFTILALILGLGRTSAARRAEALAAPPPPAVESLAEGVVFNDLEAQMREFMGYNDSIRLTPEQQAVKEEVLGSHSAVCCRNSSALECCCPCNLSKSVWGLSNYLIAKKGYGPAELDKAVEEWMSFTNPAGYTGDACYSDGGCERSPRENGCGGMSASNLVV